MHARYRRDMRPNSPLLRRIELMSKFQDTMRRVITGDNAHGQSIVIVDGGPSSEKGNPDLGEMFEIWEDAAFGPLTPSVNEDLGAARPVLGPRKGNFQVRWFAIHPRPEGAPKPSLDASMREQFAEFYGAGHIIDQTLHPGMPRLIRSTSSVSCREKHLSYSKVAKLDCGQETLSYSAVPTTPGRHTVAPRSSWPC
jgi:hypothetical protein